MAFRLLKLGTKVGLVGGVVYYTVEEGVWKDSEHSTEIYSKAYKAVAPYVKEVPVENYWNKGVMSSFEFVSDLPNKTVEWSKQGYEYVSKQLDADQKNPTPTKS
ncbi:hypothetical protein C0J52_08993 [Blattella germanica]|nr:hypothetical protein C0J52_08993 [Blattella germanica]